MKYEEIKQNFIQKFFNKLYKYGCCTCKQFIVNDVQQRLMFPCKYNEEDDVMTINLGDGVVVDVKFMWEERHTGKIPSYRLVNIF